MSHKNGVSATVLKLSSVELPRKNTVFCVPVTVPTTASLCKKEWFFDLLC